MTQPDATTRIRFETLDLEQLPDSRCRGEVMLSWSDENRVTGVAEGVSSPTGLLRCAAEAATRALELAVDNRVLLNLQGVTTIKAFDTVIVVVSLASQVSDHEQRVVGSAVVDGQAVQAAVRAVLNATNRLLGDNLIFLR